MAIRNTAKQRWKEVFIEVLKKHHKRNIEKKAAKLLTKADNVKRSMVTRSKKYDVECDITLDEIRQMFVDSYGTNCHYTGRLLTIENMVFDHVIPVSKGGPSTRDNIQVISRFANSMKGSLSEEHFRILLEWLQMAPEELRKDVSIRLAHGIR